MERPVGVKVIAVASFLLGTLLFAGSVYGILWMAKAPGGGDSWGLAPYLTGAFVILVAVVFGIGVLFFALGLGLLNMRKWARSLGVALALLNLSWVAVGIFSLLVSIAEMFRPARIDPSSFASGNWVAILLISGAIDAGVLYYLSRPHLKQAFGEAGYPPPRPPRPRA